MASASNVNLKGFGLAAEWDSKNFNPILAIWDLPVQLAEGVEQESGGGEVIVAFSTGGKSGRAWI